MKKYLINQEIPLLLCIVFISKYPISNPNFKQYSKNNGILRHVHKCRLSGFTKTYILNYIHMYICT